MFRTNIMIRITLPSGDVREFPEGVTGMEVAKSISSGLAREALGIFVNDQPSSVTLMRPSFARMNVPTRAGVAPGRTMSFPEAEPKVVSGLVRNDKPAMVSQPVSEVSLVSSSRRYCSTEAR